MSLLIGSILTSSSAPHSPPMVDEYVQTDSGSSESDSASSFSFSQNSGSLEHPPHVSQQGAWLTLSGSDGYGSMGMASSGSDGSDHELSPHEFENMALQHRCIEVAEHLLLSKLLRIPETPETPDCSRAMLRKVTDILGKHKELFDGFILRLEEDNNKLVDSTNIQLYAILEGVGEELFEDSQSLNWGRIVAFYAFGVRLAESLNDAGGRKVPKNQTRQEAVREIIGGLSYMIGVCVAEKTGCWIEDVGSGWEYFAACFGSDKPAPAGAAPAADPDQMNLDESDNAAPAPAGSVSNKMLTGIAMTAGVGVGLGLLGLSLKQ